MANDDNNDRWLAVDPATWVGARIALPAGRVRRVGPGRRDATHMATG